MSRHGEITLEWGDGEYKFRIGHRELEAIQVACDAGPPLIARRLLPIDPDNPYLNPNADTWKVQDIREVIRIGLVGSGMDQGVALGLVRKFVDGVPLIDNREIAYLLLRAAITGVPDEVLGKVAGVAKTKTKATGSRTRKSPSDHSSDMPQ